MSRTKLEKEPRRHVKIYIFNVYSFHHHRRCWPISIQYLPVNCAACVSTTHTMWAYSPKFGQCWASVAAQCWFNADKVFRMLARHYTNTGSAVYLAAAPQHIRVIYPILFQCLFNVFDAGATLKQH